MISCSVGVDMAMEHEIESLNVKKERERVNKKRRKRRMRRKNNSLFSTSRCCTGFARPTVKYTEAQFPPCFTFPCLILSLGVEHIASMLSFLCGCPLVSEGSFSSEA